MPQSVGLMYLTCGCLEAIFYGINCVLFGFCILALTSNNTSCYRVLAATITQFSLSTAHVIITIVELLQAFSPGSDPDAYYKARGNLYIAGFYVYTANSYTQELLLIWRLYGLWGRQIKFCIIPLILWCGHVCFGTMATSSFIPTTAAGSPHYVYVFGLSGWGFETATILTANFGIAYRLWKAELDTFPLGKQRHINYRSTILLIVESGLLITTSIIIMFSLWATGHESGIAGVGVATQIATVSPFLIVARIGLAQAQSRPSLRTFSQIPVEIGILRTESTFVDSAKPSPPGRRWVLNSMQS